jgi:hypothetical protein
MQHSIIRKMLLTELFLLVIFMGIPSKNGNCPFRISIVCLEITQHLPKNVLNFSCSWVRTFPLGHLNDDMTTAGELVSAESASRKKQLQRSFQDPSQQVLNFGRPSYHEHYLEILLNSTLSFSHHH